MSRNHTVPDAAAYNIYGYVRLVLRTADAGFVRYFENEYRRLDVLAGPPGAGTRPTTVTVHIVGALPPAQPGDIRREVHFKKLFRHAYLVRGLDSADVHLYFRNHPVARLYPTAVGVFLQGQVLEPILYMKLLERGVLLMHAAGVADGEHGYLFPAHGGTGKTTLSLNLVAAGFELLGDDLLLVDPAARKVYAYPRPLHLFAYNAATLRNARIPARATAAIRVKDVLRFVLECTTRQEFLIATRVHVDELYPSVAFSRPVTYRKLRFLKKAGDDERVCPDDERAREEVASRIVASADLNRSLYANILGEGEWAARVRSRELDVTRRVLADMAEIEFVNTRRMNLDDLTRFAATLRQ